MRGMGFKSRADQIFHTLPMIRRYMKPWSVYPSSTSHGDVGTAHSWHPKGY